MKRRWPKKKDDGGRLKQTPQVSEPVHPLWPAYLKEKGITQHGADCSCYSCNANRRYFQEIWLQNVEGVHDQDWKAVFEL